MFTAYNAHTATQAFILVHVGFLLFRTGDRLHFDSAEGAALTLLAAFAKFLFHLAR
jgi:hypothetical protein